MQIPTQHEIEYGKKANKKLPVRKSATLGSVSHRKYFTAEFLPRIVLPMTAPASKSPRILLRQTLRAEVSTQDGSTDGRWKGRKPLAPEVPSVGMNPDYYKVHGGL
jgi:hypothetical protein